MFQYYLLSTIRTTTNVVIHKCFYEPGVSFLLFALMYCFLYCHTIWANTRNSPLHEIGKSYRLNHAMVGKVYHSYTRFPHKVRLSDGDSSFSTHRYFWLLCLILLFTDHFIVDMANPKHVVWRTLLEGLECYCDPMKAYDIILTTKLKSDTVQYRNKIIYIILTLFCVAVVNRSLA